MSYHAKTTHVNADGVAAAWIRAVALSEGVHSTVSVTKVKMMTMLLVLVLAGSGMERVAQQSPLSPRPTVAG